MDLIEQVGATCLASQMWNDYNSFKLVSLNIEVRAHHLAMNS